MTNNHQHILNMMEIIAQDEDAIESLQVEIARLRATIAERDAEIAQLRAQVAQLGEKLNAVPIDAIAFCVDVAESAYWRTKHSEAVTEWANRIVAAQEER
jgi:prefoldin subunit 5